MVCLAQFLEDLVVRLALQVVFVLVARKEALAQTVDISSVAVYYQLLDYLVLYSMILPLSTSMFTLYFMNKIEKGAKRQEKTNWPKSLVFF